MVQPVGESSHSLTFKQHPLGTTCELIALFTITGRMHRKRRCRVPPLFRVGTAPCSPHPGRFVFSCCRCRCVSVCMREHVMKQEKVSDIFRVQRNLFSLVGGTEGEAHGARNQKLQNKMETDMLLSLLLFFPNQSHPRVQIHT